MRLREAHEHQQSRAPEPPRDNRRAQSVNRQPSLADDIPEPPRPSVRTRSGSQGRQQSQSQAVGQFGGQHRPVQAQPGNRNQDRNQMTSTPQPSEGADRSMETIDPRAAEEYMEGLYMKITQGFIHTTGLVREGALSLAGMDYCLRKLGRISPSKMW